MTTSFPQQGKRQRANLRTPTLRNAQQVAGQVEFVPQVVVEDLRRLCKLALGRVSREAGLLESPLHEIARAQCSSARAFYHEGKIVQVNHDCNRVLAKKLDQGAHMFREHQRTCSRSKDQSIRAEFHHLVKGGTTCATRAIEDAGGGRRQRGGLARR